MFHGATAAGTQRDIQARTDLAAEFPYFAEAEEATRFISMAVSKVESALPKKSLRYVDFGGGQGHLAVAVSRHLESTGRQVETLVADANPAYLMDAVKAGLEVLPCNLENYQHTPADLITMRLVNHYNTRVMQLEILKRAQDGLKVGHPLLVQIDTGSKENCRLKTDIANLLAKYHNEKAGYYWATANNFETLLQSAGFNIVERHDHAWQFQTPVTRLLESSWLRFSNDSDTQDTESIQQTFIDESLSLIEERLARLGSASLGLMESDSGRMMHSTHTLFVAVRS